MFGKIRLALFEKRPHAFNAILGFQSHLLRAAFGTQLFLQRIVESRGMQGANLPENSAGTCGEAMRYGLRAPEKFAGGNHGIDQAPFERGLGIDSFREHQRRQGAACANAARQVKGDSGIGHQP